MRKTILTISVLLYILCGSVFCADTTIKGTTTTDSTAGLEVTDSGNSSVLFVGNGGSTRVGKVASGPNATLDAAGDFAMRRGNFTASNGTNASISIGSNSFIRISGPTAAFTITGIGGGVDGKLVILYNSTSQNMTLANDTGAANSRILTNTGADVTTTGTGSATLIYDTAVNNWLLIGFES